MQSVVESLREVLGIPDFYSSSGSIDYGAVTEYVLAGIILCIIISSIFKFIYNWVKN